MSEPAPITSLAAVRAMIADRKPIKSPPRQVAQPSGSPGDWDHRHDLPPDCPVKPLGIQGDRLWFLDGIGQVRVMDPPYGKGPVLGLFLGRIDYLAWAWPRWGKADEETGKAAVNGYANEDVSAALIRACANKGPWDSMDRIRGRGCWTDSGGNLIIHVGTAIISGRSAVPPGELDGHVYPTRAEIAPPLALKEPLPFDPGAILRDTLARWNWERPGVDPHLLLGWIGAAFLGAALPWRPMVFMTGDKGTGKSTLQELLKALFGGWLIQSADTTPAGIYQHVGLDSVPVAVDELESENDTRKTVAILKLARLASSGAAMLRGGDRHQGVEFNARSAFIFSSINAPPLPPQDLSRMALLNLRRLVAGTKPPELDARTFGVIGRAVLRRLWEEWPRFRQTFDAFAGELAAAGMDGRGQAQYGTLLTCADMISHHGWDDERLRHASDIDGDLVPWRDLLRPSNMLEFENATENWHGCIRHLLSVRVEAWRSGLRTTVGQVLQAYHDGEDGCDITAANGQLSQAGLRIVFKRAAGGKHRHFLAVQNNGPLVRELFQGSKWHGDIGAGIWSQALRQGPRGAFWEVGNERVNGVKDRCTLIALDGLYGPDGIMREEHEPEP